jgi:hypothetical protein
VRTDLRGATRFHHANSDAGGTPECSTASGKSKEADPINLIGSFFIDYKIGGLAIDSGYQSSYYIYERQNWFDLSKTGEQPTVARWAE